MSRNRDTWSDLDEYDSGHSEEGDDELAFVAGGGSGSNRNRNRNRQRLERFLERKRLQESIHDEFYGPDRPKRRRNERRHPA